MLGTCRRFRWTLEAETGAELAGERAGHDDAARSDESGGLHEIGGADAGLLGAAEVGAIRQVERLEDQFEFGSLAELQGLAEPRVELEERVAAEEVVGHLVAGSARDASL